MNNENQAVQESESDRVMREQAQQLMTKKKQPKVVKEPSAAFDSANYEMNKLKHKS